VRSGLTRNSSRMETYFVVEAGAAIVGWRRLELPANTFLVAISRAERDSGLLDPRTEPARISRVLCRSRVSRAEASAPCCWRNANPEAPPCVGFHGSS